MASPAGLARRVSELGEFGVVPGTAIDTVLVRELQGGDPHGRLGALETYPDQEVVTYLKERFYVDGRLRGTGAYRLLPVHRVKPTLQLQRILSAAAYSEVYLESRTLTQNRSSNNQNSRNESNG